MDPKANPSTKPCQENSHHSTVKGNPLDQIKCD
jgi:hypothetical protein